MNALMGLGMTLLKAFTFGNIFVQDSILLSFLFSILTITWLVGFAPIRRYVAVLAPLALLLFLIRHIGTLGEGVWEVIWSFGWYISLLIIGVLGFVIIQAGWSILSKIFEFGKGMWGKTKEVAKQEKPHWIWMGVGVLTANGFINRPFTSSWDKNYFFPSIVSCLIGASFIASFIHYHQTGYWPWEMEWWPTWLKRKPKQPGVQPAPDAPPTPDAPPQPAVAPVPGQDPVAPQPQPGGEVATQVVTSNEVLVCPTCKRQYPATFKLCTNPGCGNRGRSLGVVSVQSTVKFSMKR